MSRPIYGTMEDVEIGDVFPTNNNGDCVLLEKIKKGSNPTVLIKFVETGHQKEVQLVNLLIGNIKDPMRPSRFGVGYLGVGKYSFSRDGKATLCARKWKSMLERCYCKKHAIKRPSYVGCTVAEEWHNFQNFAKWFYENYPGDGGCYELDKDRLVAGNRVYGPDTCCFLSHEENTMISSVKSYIFVSPEKEVVSFTNMNEFCRKNNLNSKNMHQVNNGKRKSSKGWTRYVEQQVEADN